MSRHQPTHVGTLTGHLRFDRISSRLAAMFHNNPGHKWCCEWCFGHAKMNKIVIFQLFLAETEGNTSKTYNIDSLVNFSSISVACPLDRKIVVEGKSVYVSVMLGDGRSMIK